MYLIVNFGGPRSLNEIEIFLKTLLCDQDVIPSKLPPFLHKFLFSRIAKERAVKIRVDYEEIGGASPIYADTERLASALSAKLNAPVLTFHRYLPSTHKDALAKISQHNSLKVIPLFPQFCYATTGSIARFFAPLPQNKLRWVKSYAAHPAFIKSYQRRIKDFLQKQNLKEEETLLLFSAHGVPVTFIEEGDLYERECNLSFENVMKAFPNAKGHLSYQSKFGKGEWLRPYTNEACEDLSSFNRKNVVIIPISFTSDHIETLFEIEKLYLPPIRAQGLNAYRCPALNLEPYWIDALVEIAQSSDLCNNRMLIK